MKNNKVKVIAEIGPNHNGDYKKALRMITFLKKLNIYGVKFQINNVEKSYSKDAFKANYQKNHIKETPSEMTLTSTVDVVGALREIVNRAVRYMCQYTLLLCLS